MAVVSNAEAMRLGASPFGDADAPIVDRTISFFNADVLPVRDERVEDDRRARAAVAGPTAVASAVQLNAAPELGIA